jgi:crotonobetainyl-CoA:carnitine CoA-transferase CaiB-like acyl-CoA transferase
VTVRTDDEWRALLTLVGTVPAVPGSADRATRGEHHDVIDAAIARWTGTRSACSAARALQSTGIAACPAFTNRDLVEDPHLRARRFIVEWDQPDVGRRRYPGFPVHFERLTVAMRPAPTLGHDNDDVLGALGYGEDELAALATAGTTATVPPS